MRLLPAKNPYQCQIIGAGPAGIGMHILPDAFHGEKSFDGSLNGLQSYPLAITPAIIQSIIDNA